MPALLHAVAAAAAASSSGPAAATSYTIARDYVVILVVQSIFTLVAAVCVGLRIFQQRRNWGLWWDDWACLGALILSLGLLGSLAVRATIGRGGHHVATFTLEDTMIFWKTLVASEIIYSASVSMSKIAVLFLYRRVFAQANTSRSAVYWNVLLCLVFAFWITSFFGVLFAFTPVRAQWDPTVAPTRVIELRSFYVSTCTIDAALDIAILAFPQTKIWKIHMCKKKKLLVSGVFLLGSFVCIASISRLVYFATYDDSDIPHNVTPVDLWTGIEAPTSVVCSCLPVLYKLFTGGETTDDSKKYITSTSAASSHYRRIAAARASNLSDPKLIPGSSKGPSTVIESGRRSQVDEEYGDTRLYSLGHVHVRNEFTITESR